MITLTSRLKVSQVRNPSIHMPSMMSHVSAFVVSSCLFSPVYLSLLPFLVHCVLVLCPAQLPPCRHRFGLEPLHSRTVRCIAPWRCSILSHGKEPKLLENFDHPETSAIVYQDESGDKDAEPSHSCDAELDDENIGKALSSPLFIQEREEPANLRQACHSQEESLLPAHSFFEHTRTGRPVHELSSCQKRKSSREMENERIRILFERQKEQILAEVGTDIQKHEVQSDSRKSIQEFNGIIESQRREIDHTLACEQLRRDQLLQEQLSEQNP